MNKLLILLLLIIFYAYPQQNIRDEFVKNFVYDFINNPEKTFNYLDSTSQKIVKRFNIQYENNQYKHLMSSGIDEQIRSQLKSGELQLDYKIENLPESFFRVYFTIPNRDITGYFYFKNYNLITRSVYLTNHWTLRQTQYVDYLVREKEFFNSTCGTETERFLNRMFIVLDFTQQEKDLLKSERIRYIVARDENNVSDFTGYKDFGGYLKESDEIITSTNINFKDLAIFLLNFKIRNLTSDINPLLEQGFGAAFGGRKYHPGSILMRIGQFLIDSSYFSPSEAVTKNIFLEDEAALAFPVAAIYNWFLFNKLGTEGYIETYLSSNNLELTTNSKLNESILPYFEEFKKAYQNIEFQKWIKAEETKDSMPAMFQGDRVRIFDAGEYYYFQTRGSFALSEDPPISKYKTNLLKEMIRGRVYEGEKYLIYVTRDDVILYNLYLNRIIDAHYSGFDKKKIPGIFDYYEFFIKKGDFEEPLETLIIKEFY